MGGLVFPGCDGKPILPENFMNRQFRPALKRAQLWHRRNVTFHSLRDTYAALVAKAGGHPKYLQEMMGHASMRTTMDDYGGLFERVNPAAAQRLEDIFLAASGDKMLTADEVVN